MRGGLGAAHVAQVEEGEAARRADGLRVPQHLQCVVCDMQVWHIDDTVRHDVL